MYNYILLNRELNKMQIYSPNIYLLEENIVSLMSSKFYYNLIINEKHKIKIDKIFDYLSWNERSIELYFKNKNAMLNILNKIIKEIPDIKLYKY